MIDGSVDGDLKLSLAPDDESNQRIELTVDAQEVDVDGPVIYSGSLESESRTACGWLQFLRSDAAIICHCWRCEKCQDQILPLDGVEWQLIIETNEPGEVDRSLQGLGNPLLQFELTNLGFRRLMVQNYIKLWVSCTLSIFFAPSAQKRMEDNSQDDFRSICLSVLSDAQCIDCHLRFGKALVLKHCGLQLLSNVVLFEFQL